jgi:hypothetical protein
LKRTRLEHLFDYNNRKYFYKKLPRYRVRWDRKICRRGWLGECDEKTISLAYELKRWGLNRVIKQTLLHEMVHARLLVGDGDGDVGHGRNFQKEMLRLARAGAFKNLW